MRLALTFLLVVHGAIHLFGVLKWWKLADVPQLGGRTSISLSEGAARVFGTGWAIAMVLFLLGASQLATHHERWWAAALAGTLLSQALIVIAWRDAKFGSLANVILVVVAIAAAAHERFEERTDAEVRELMARPAKDGADDGSPVQSNELDRLPAPVHRWLAASGIVGRPRARTIRLRQRGELRTAADQPWMSAHAEQYFSVDPPGFVWKVETAMMKVLPIDGRDRYFGGDGHMSIKAASLVTVVDAHDDKIALGAMLRFVGEIVWFPSAALSKYLEWSPIDENRAKVTMRDAGKTVSAEFTIDARGRVTEVRAERWLGGGADAKLTPWVVPCSEWRFVRGVEIPVRGDVVWKLAAGDFDYYRWEILDVETNVDERYP